MRGVFVASAIFMFLAIIAARLIMPAFLERIRIVEGSLGLIIIATSFVSAVSPIYSNALQSLKKFKAQSLISIIGAPIRLITMLIVPLMSCSARLPVYIIIIGAFFPNNSALILFGLYLTGIIMSILMAKLFSRFIVRGESSPFVMELPPYRLPTAKSVVRHTWEKGYQYLKKMGTTILVASIIIWALSYYPRPESHDTTENPIENSYIGKIGKFIEPAIRPCGFEWKEGVSIITGVGAKEIVASTMGVLYSQNGDSDSEEDEDAEFRYEDVKVYNLGLLYDCLAIVKRSNNAPAFGTTSTVNPENYVEAPKAIGTLADMPRLMAERAK